jgi:hypothetical protein
VKTRNTIDPAAVPYIFDEPCVRRLAEIVHLPQDANLARFGEAVRASVLHYIQAKAQPSQNELSHEIQNVLTLASKQQYAALAGAIEAMSGAAREWIVNQRPIINDCMSNWRIPSACELRNPTTRVATADGLVALIEFGAQWVRGRNRRSGRRSISRRSMNNSPQLTRGEPRRAAERQFVMFLQCDVARMGVKVPMWADPRKLGPFARMVVECLVLVRAIGPSNSKGLAVQLINDLQAERRACHA